MSWLGLVFFAFLACVTQTGAVAHPVLNMDGFAWAENLIFDVWGNLFVSDAQTGNFWRIFLNTTSNTYTKIVHVGGFKRCLGLAISLNSTTLYGVVTTEEGLDQVIAMNPRVPGSWKPIATLPKAGNGLALNFKTGNLYVTTEASFIPTRGEVYVITRSGTVSTFVSDLWAADGAWIDQVRQILYISEVLNAKIFAYNLTNGHELYSYKAPAIMVDDFCLSPDGTIMYGADFWNGTVVAWKADGSGDLGIVATGLQQPTSVRLGYGKDFQSNGLYVTEGGGIFPWIKSRRVLQIVK